MGADTFTSLCWLPSVSDGSGQADTEIAAAAAAAASAASNDADDHADGDWMDSSDDCDDHEEDDTHLDSKYMSADCLQGLPFKFVITKEARASWARMQDPWRYAVAHNPTKIYRCISSA